MKQLLVIPLLLIGLLLTVGTQAQETDEVQEKIEKAEVKPVIKPEQISSEDFKTLQQYEDSLSVKFDEIRTNPKQEERFESTRNFVPMLVEALKTPNSYYYPFSSFEHISILNAPDNSFRIFTWLVVQQGRNDYDFTYKYYGAIQHQSSELKLIGLQDKSSRISRAGDRELDAENWYGVVYYDIMQYEHKDTTYYTLFGWDGNNHKSDKKIADVLFFRDGKAIFGSPVFEVVDKKKLSVDHRLILEFKEGSLVSLNYNKDKEMIVFDYLTTEDSETEEIAGSNFAYIPDGTYQALAFNKVEGLWKHVPKVFNRVTPVSSKPVPEPDDVVGSSKSKSKKQSRKKKRVKKKKRKRSR